MTNFAAAMRRVITGDNAKGESLVIIDGPPASTTGPVDLGGLFDIWHDKASGPLDPRDHRDLGPKRPVLSPDSGTVKVRWVCRPNSSMRPCASTSPRSAPSIT